MSAQRLQPYIYLGDRRDPDDYHNYTRDRTLLWLLHYVRLLFGAFLYVLLIPMMAYRHGTPRERRRIIIEYSLLGLAYTLLFVAVPHKLLLQVWIIPLVIVAYMVNIRGFTQHGLTDAGDPLLASRSIEASRAVAFCLLNENYHLEHHLFPEIPSYNLARLHALVWSRLPRALTGSSYLGFLGSFFRATLTRDETPIGLATGRQAGD
jgi:fatty acid desaturase